MKKTIAFFVVLVICFLSRIKSITVCDSVFFAANTCPTEKTIDKQIANTVKRVIIFFI